MCDGDQPVPKTVAEAIARLPSELEVGRFRRRVGQGQSPAKQRSMLRLELN